jgi:hypothetical protein
MITAPLLPRTGSVMVAVKRSPGFDTLLESGVSSAACISVFAAITSAPFGAGEMVGTLAFAGGSGLFGFALGWAGV